MKLHKRTLLKGIIWESGGLLALFILTWAWTGQSGSASAVSIVYTAMRTIGFYFYTRLWKKIEYGKEYRQVGSVTKPLGKNSEGI